LADADSASLTDRFITVSGNIGVGKSTLVKRLAAATGSLEITESHEENPFLLPFYEEPARWSFHVQAGFLALSSADYGAVAAHAGGAILERTLEEHHEVFGAVLRERNLLSADEFALLDRLCAQASARTQASPHLLVHLTAPAEELDRRIRARSRGGEAEVSVDYLRSLNRAYEEFASGWTACPAVWIDTVAIDPRDDQGLARIVVGCERALKADFDAGPIERKQ
jgi:deoxyadenosine/deoxycytidine kinase